MLRHSVVHWYLGWTAGGWEKVAHDERPRDDHDACDKRSRVGKCASAGTAVVRSSGCLGGVALDGSASEHFVFLGGWI